MHASRSNHPMNHPYMPTPVRANQVTTTTPADSAKKAGDNTEHPINLH